MIMTPKEIPPTPNTLPFLPGVRELLPSFGVPSHVLVKDSQSGSERKSLTQECLETHYPNESLTHVYTDGSAETCAARTFV